MLHCREMPPSSLSFPPPPTVDNKLSFPPPPTLDSKMTQNWVVPPLGTIQIWAVHPLQNWRGTDSLFSNFPARIFTISELNVKFWASVSELLISFWFAWSNRLWVLENLGWSFIIFYNGFVEIVNFLFSFQNLWHLGIWYPLFCYCRQLEVLILLVFLDLRLVGMRVAGDLVLLLLEFCY